MTQLMKIRARWGGFQGAPGYSILYYSVPDAIDLEGGRFTGAQVDATLAQVYPFFQNMQTLLPQEVTIQVESEVDVLESTTGELLYSVSGAKQQLTRGAQPGPYSSAAGAVVTWRTNGVRNGRRIRGRTFIVPLAATAFNVNGILGNDTVSAIDTGAERLAGAGGDAAILTIWSRPTPGAADGQTAFVQSASVPSTGAILRSRRD